MPRFLSDDQVSALRERTCAAAERLFAEHGPEAVSMRPLAAEIGLTAMSLYRYFKDKDDILAAVRAQGFDRIAEVLERALAASMPPGCAAAPVSSAYITFALEHPAAYRLMFELTQPNEADYPELVRAVSRARRPLRAFVEQSIAAGWIEADEPEAVAHAYWAAIHGLVVLQLAGKIPSAVSFDAIRRSILGALDRGFRKG